MIRYYDISSYEKIKTAIEEIKLDLIQHKPRVHITIDFFEHRCTQCNKELEIGKEFEYAGYTRCLKCKLNAEEFDDEMS